MKKITFDELLEIFHADVHEQLKAKAAMPDVKGMVVFQNECFDSRSFGARTAMIYGNNCTYKSWEYCEGKWLYDLPSQRQHATMYWEK
jgi:hypothetical protein